MKQIPLTQGQFALVDDEDYDHLMQWKWQAGWCECTRTFYARRTYWINKKNIHVSMHRVIMKLNDRNIHVDHIDHNTLNNQKNNLRIASRSQNQANRRASGRSKYLGVFWHNKNNKWFAQIKSSDKIIYIGSYKKEEDAAKAYDQKAIEVHGEFANLNFKTA